jgi:pyrroline-5-carboxylate reductase
MNNKSIGFIGGGNMAYSLLSGLLASGHGAGQLWVADINANTRKSLSDNLQVNVTDNNDSVVEAVDVLVLAVKPQIIKDVAIAIAPLVQQKNLLIISIAAGISQASLSRWLGVNTAIVRCMPNTPALVLSSATALHANNHVNTKQRTIAENILRAVGIALWVAQESDLDAVTAVSGSGPAYYFLLMEAMESVAISMGLSAETARLLVQQTALGAAKIALESTESPETLRKRVTSPNGTTQQAIEVFQQGGFSELVDKALRAAQERSIELAKQSELL